MFLSRNWKGSFSHSNRIFRSRYYLSTGVGGWDKNHPWLGSAWLKRYHMGKYFKEGTFIKYT